MIERQAAYRVGDTVHKTLEEAQAHALQTITDISDVQAQKLIAESEEVITILRMKPRSRALRPTSTPRKRKAAANPNPPASQ